MIIRWRFTEKEDRIWNRVLLKQLLTYACADSFTLFFFSGSNGVTCTRGLASVKRKDYAAINFCDFFAIAFPGFHASEKGLP